MLFRGKGRPAVLQTLIFRGSAYSTSVQIINAASNLVLTPYIISVLGATTFGVIVVATAYLSILSIANSGLLTATARFAAVYQRDADSGALQRFIRSALASLSALAVLFSVVVYLLAPYLISLVDLTPAMADDGVFLLRVLGALALLALPTGLLGAVLGAQGRFRATSLAAIAGQAAYALSMVYVLGISRDLRGYAAAAVARQVVMLLCMLGPSLRFLFSMRGRDRLDRSDRRAYWRFAAQLSLAQALGTVDQSADAVVIGSFAGPRAVGLYGAGNNFASQLRAIPLNALGPISISLSREYGSGGAPAARDKYLRLERLWVIVTAGYSAALIGSAYFAVLTWLGPQFRQAAVYAVLLVAADAVNLWTGTLTAYLNSLGRSDIELRYGLVAVVINVGLTVPLVFFGPLGVVMGTVVGEIVGSVLLMRIARKRLGTGEVLDFLRWVPKARFAFVVAAVAMMEFALLGHLPQGPVGLLGCGGPAFLGLLIYAALSRPRVLLAALRS